MRKRHVRNRLDFRHLEYSKIGLPLVESIQRMMIRAEIFGQTLPANRSIGNSGTAPVGITPFHFNNGVDKLFLRPFGPGRRPRLGENNMRYFRLLSTL